MKLIFVALWSLFATQAVAFDDPCEMEDPVFAELNWPEIKLEMRELMATQKNSYFQKMRSRQVYKFYIYEYQKLSFEPTFSSVCPMGVVFLRLFVMLLSNDLDRCLELRDNKIAIELFDFRFAFVMLGGWPVFGGLARLSDETRNVVYPLPNDCDDLDRENQAQFEFRDALRKFYENKRAPTVTFVVDHIAKHGYPKCGLGVATVKFALVSALRHHHGCQGDLCANDLEDFVTKDDVAVLLKEGQDAFRDAITSHESIYESITSKWPMWHILDQVMAENVLPGVEDEVSRKEFSVAVHYCGGDEEVGWELMQQGTDRGWAVRVQVDAGIGCGQWHVDAAGASQEDLVLVVSPHTYRWTGNNSEAVTSLLENFYDETIKAVGFPTVNQTNYWDFPVARIRRREGGKIVYEDYPSGYDSWSGQTCFGGQVSSGTRLYRRTLWQDLVSQFTDIEGAEISHAWLFDVDMYALSDVHLENKEVTIAASGIAEPIVEPVAISDLERYRVHTCMSVYPLYENDYRQLASVPQMQAVRYELDVVAFTITNIEILCSATTARGAELSSSEFSTNELSWCYRRSLMRLTERLRFFGAQSSQKHALISEYVEKWGAMPSAAVDLENDPLVFRVAGDLEQEILSELSEFEFLETLCDDSSPGVASCRDVYELRGRRLARVLFSDASAPAHPRGLLSVDFDSSISYTEGVGVPDTVVVFYCHDPGRIDANADQMNQHVQGACEAFGWQCVIATDKCVQRLSEIDNTNNFVLVISPFALHFHQSIVHDLFAHVSSSRAVIGVAHSNEHGEWSWPARRVRHEYWKAIWEVPPPHCDDQCCVALPGATSGTRLYLPTILDGVLPHTNALKEKAIYDNSTTFLLDLDLAGARVDLPVTTCQADVRMLTEKSYLDDAVIGREFGSTFAVEYLQFTPENKQVQCLGMDWFGILKYGLVGSFCFRRDVERTLRGIRNWWVDSAPDGHFRFMVPEEGTMLANWRNGKRGTMPWDSDFDAKLYDVGHIAQPNITTEGSPVFTKENNVEVFHYAGCTHQQYALVRRPNITHHIGDLYIAGDQDLDEYRWTTTLFNVEVRLSPQHLYHTFFERYGKPLAKYFGDGEPLHCNVPDHNACMPDCWEAPRGNSACEFYSRTVQIDELTADDSPLYVF